MQWSKLTYTLNFQTEQSSPIYLLTLNHHTPSECASTIFHLPCIILVDPKWIPLKLLIKVTIQRHTTQDPCCCFDWASHQVPCCVELLTFTLIIFHALRVLVGTSKQIIWQTPLLFRGVAGEQDWGQPAVENRSVHDSDSQTFSYSGPRVTAGLRGVESPTFFAVIMLEKWKKLM